MPPSLGNSSLGGIPHGMDGDSHSGARDDLLPIFFTQTDAWGQVHEAAYGGGWLRLREAQYSGEVSLLLTLRPRPGIASIRSPRGILEAIRCCSVLSADYGPTLEGSPSWSQLARLTDELVSIWRRSGGAQLVVRMSPFAPDTATDVVRQRLDREGFAESKWQTSILNLEDDASHLFKGLPASVRKQVKKQRRLDARITWLDRASDVKSLYYPALNDSRLRMGFSPVSGRAMSAMLSADWHDYYRFGICQTKAGDVLGVLGMCIGRGVVQEVGSGRTRVGAQLGWPISDWLHWDAIQVAKALGVRWFDFAGFNPNPTTTAERGIASFKQKWSPWHPTYAVFTSSDQQEGPLRRMAAKAFAWERDHRR